MFASLTLQEPPKAEVRAWRAGEPITRRAKAVMRRSLTTFEAVVDLGSGKVVSHEEKPGMQPMVALPELLSAMEVTTSDSRMP